MPCDDGERTTFVTDWRGRDIDQHYGQSRVIYPKVLATLYATVKLYGAAQGQDTLAMRRDTPDVARHVQELEVYPDYISDSRIAGYEESAEWCAKVSQLIADAAKNMDALKKLTWNALAALPHENMWSELRRW